MDPARFLQGRSRETTIVRDAQGRWYQDGQPLEHANLTRAFDRWLCRADDGRYCLKNDINWAYVEVQGPTHFVRRARVAPEGVWLFLSNDQEVLLEPQSLRQGPDHALYCDVGDGLTARFDRLAATQLEDLIEEDGQGVYLQVDGRKVRPPVVDSPLGPGPDGEQRKAP